MFSYNPVDLFGRTVIPFGLQHCATVPSLPLIGSFFPQVATNVIPGTQTIPQLPYGVMNPALCGTQTIPQLPYGVMNPALCGTQTIPQVPFGVVNPALCGTLPVDLRSLCGTLPVNDIRNFVHPYALPCASMIRPTVFGTQIPQVVPQHVWGGIPRETVVG